MPDRFLKETIRSSKSVNSLSDFDFRVWAYLITYVDDAGRGSADPELLKGFLFPRRHGITNEQIGKSLATLASKGMITLYSVDGESFFYFPKWGKHQQADGTSIKFPEPNGKQEAGAENQQTTESVTQATKARSDLSLSLKEYVEQINPEADEAEIAKLKTFETQMGAYVIHRIVALAVKNNVKDPSLVLKMLSKAQKAGVTNQFELELFLRKRKGARNGTI